jgi:hypothetical protein
MSCFTYYRLQLWNYKMYGAEFYHWPLWISDIPNAFACDRTSKAADCDSSSSNWFMRRSSVRTAWVSLLHWRRPRVFQPTGWWAKFCTQVLRAKFIECLLYCYHLSMSGWNLTERAIQSNRELGEWLPRSRLSSIIIDSRSHVHSKDIICPVVCRFICEQPKLLKYCAMNGAHEAVPKNMCIWNQGWVSEQGDVGIFVLRLLFHLKWNQCLHNRLTTRNLKS